MITMDDLRNYQVKDITKLAKFLEEYSEDDRPEGITACEFAIQVIKAQRTLLQHKANHIASLELLLMEVQERGGIEGQ